MQSTRILGAALLLLFFASGFAALLYQVVWQRLLTLITGLDLQATTTIVAAFMLGMGFGSLAGGYLADRLQPRRLLIVFAVAELAIAAFALASKTLYVDWFYLELVPRLAPGTLATVACLTLLIPTFFMGLTLPVLAKVITHRVEAAAGRIAGLYGWNTLGAATGAWLGSAWLIRSYGYEQALWFGAALNLASGLAALLLLRSAEPGTLPEPRAGAVEPALVVGTQLSFRTWLLLYFLSGFVALGLEMVWFRLLGVSLKSTSFTFPLLLAFYLVGVGAGSLAGRFLARRSRDPARGFLRLQTCIPLYAAVSVFLLTVALRYVEGARTYVGNSGPLPFAFDFGELNGNQRLFYLGLPALLILPPCLLMGMSFPFMQRAVQSDVARLGRRVGWLQATNILGCTIGVVVTGLVMLDWLGTSGTLAAMALLSLVFSGLAAWQARSARSLRLLLAVAGAALCAWIVPGSAALWASMHGTKAEWIIHGEDGSGLALLRNMQGDFEHSTVFVNGLGQSWIPFGREHTWLGVMPALLHPAPKAVAVIGLGSGDTAFAVGARSETTSIHCIEIMGKQIETLRTLHQRRPYGGLESLLTDPRITQVTGDGRRFVMQGQRRYDIIEADALRPNSAYSGSLFSREYFQLLSRNLAPGGFAVTWRPTERTQHTFLSVFPHVVEIPPMLIGSNEPITVDFEAVRARAASERVRNYFARAGIDIVPDVNQMLASLRPVPRPAVPAEASMINTDLFPRDELSAR